MADSTQELPPKKPTPRRRQRRKEARPQEIVETAMRLWAEKGFSGTRLEEVAKGAGVAKGTIYLYFANKEALFEAALAQTLVAMMNSASEDIDRFQGDTQSLLLQFFERIRKELVDTGSVVLLKILIGEGHRFPALVALHRDVALSRGMATLRKILQRGVARGELRADAAETDPRIVMGPVMTAALWSLVYPESTFPPTQRLIEQHAALLCLGLRADS